MPKKAEWRGLSKTKLEKFLLENVNICDSAWTDEDRLPGESRESFIKRVCGRAKAIA